LGKPFTNNILPQSYIMALSASFQLFRHCFSLPTVTFLLTATMGFLKLSFLFSSNPSYLGCQIYL
jgi:hypothetical protein